MHYDYSTLLATQKLPNLVFIVTSVLLVIASFARLFFSRWHCYYYGFWSAVFPMLLGLAGLYHKAHYLSVAKVGGVTLAGMGTYGKAIYETLLYMLIS